MAVPSFYLAFGVGKGLGKLALIRETIGRIQFYLSYAKIFECPIKTTN